MRVICIHANPSSEVAPSFALAHDKLRHLQNHGLNAVLKTTTCVVVTDQHEDDLGEVYTLPARGGVILGRLFSNRNSAQLTPLSSRDPTLVASQRNTLSEHDLIKDFWGDYLAFILTDAGIKVLRSPSPTARCFYLQTPDFTAFASDISDLKYLIDRALPVDLSFISTYLTYGYSASRKTGYADVQEILAGECIQIVNGRLQCEPTWRIDVAHGPATDSYADMVQELRLCIDRCISAYAQLFPKLVLKLSGGFDSSVVLSSLSQANAGQKILCHNIYSSDADERRYAREIAHHLDVELVETPLTLSAHDLDEFAEFPHRARPTLSIFTAPQNRDLESIAQRSGAKAVFTGVGGDQIFYKIRADLLGADVLRAFGPGPTFLRSLLSTSNLARVSVWASMKMAIYPESSITYAPTYVPISVCPSFFSERALQSARPTMHPSLKTDAHILPGKLFQLHLILNALDRENSYSKIGGLTTIHPLLSQPIVEMCARIPIYMLANNGRHRGLARDAFSDVLPPTIRDRETKGIANQYFTDMLVQNSSSFRELLVGGELANEGLISQGAVDDAFRSNRMWRTTEVTPILRSVAAELWLRAARETPATVPARSNFRPSDVLTMTSSR